MRRYLLITILGLILAIAGVGSKTANAASEYDDLVEKMTTKTMINHINNYYSRRDCGSPGDDYAQKWLYTFRQKFYALRYKDFDEHDKAVKSLGRAMKSPDGAYMVLYAQRNNGNNSSNPLLAAVYWTESNKNDFSIQFGSSRGDRYLRVQSTSPSSKLHVALLSSPALTEDYGSACLPEATRIMFNYTRDFILWENFSEKIFVSTFNTIYPQGYDGMKIPSEDPALNWMPQSTPHDDTVAKISTPVLVNHVISHRGESCGSSLNDRANHWLSDVSKNKALPRDNHGEYLASLKRAIAHGDYAIYHTQYGYNSDYQRTNSSFASIFWTERKHQYEFILSGEGNEKGMFLGQKVDNPATLYEARIASPRYFKPMAWGGCEVEFIEGNTQHNRSDMQLMVAYQTKIFSSTFDVRYPYGYKGRPVPGPAKSLDYLALGDSFSSGEGDTEKNSLTNQKYYRQLTDVNEDKAKGVPKEKCHISTRSYPYKLARQMGLTQTGTKQWDTVACSGATIYDMNWDNSAGYEGQDSPLGRLNGLTNKDTLKGMALNEMIPGRVKQIEFVKKYQPKVITLTAGGNDVGFADKLKACVGPESALDDCIYTKTSERQKIKREILDQFEHLKSFYNEIKSVTNDKTKIYVLGYPQFINGDPSASCSGTLTLSPREREMITNSVSYLNSVISHAAKAAGVKYIDMENVFGDHWLCGSKPRHFNPLLLIEEAISRYPDSQLPPVERQESFHPNAKGHEDMARSFKQQLGGINPLDYKICADGSNSCPDPKATKDSIPEPEYFRIANEQEDIKFTHYQLTDGTATKVEKKSIPIKTSRRPFKPRKIVYVKIYSEPRDLGEIETDENGEIDGTVQLPADLPAGYHTLVVSGEAPDGTKQELYQTILIKGSNPEDIDENGTPDKNQPCGAFIQAANKDEDLDTIDDACDPEITDPILYTARNGNIELGEDEDRIYLFRNTRASELTGVTNDYVDKSKNQNNTNALVGYTLDEETRGLAFEKLIIMEEDNTNISITKGTPIILAKDINDKCYALKPEDYLSPALKPGSSNYKPRGLIKLNTLPKGVKCEE